MNLKFLFVLFFLVLTILYYFLRFQTGLINQFAILQVVFLTMAAIWGVGYLAASGLRVEKNNMVLSPDFLFFILIIHGFLFVPFIFIRDGFYQAAYSGLHVILPFLTYFFFSRAFTIKERVHIIIIVNIVMLIVAIIYFWEFISLFILGGELMTYSVTLDDYVENELGIEGGTSKSTFKGDIYTLIRFAGPLSHNNTTGLALAFGLIISFGGLFSFKRKLYFPIFIFFAFVLLLTAARTSIISGVIGILTIILLRDGFFQGFIKIARALLVACIPVVFLVSGLIFYSFIDLKAFSEIYSVENFSRSADYMLNFNKNPSFEMYLNQLLSNPLLALTGFGHPTKEVFQIPFNSSFKEEDTFFIEFFSRYGLVIPIILLAMLFQKAIIIRKIMKKGDILNSYKYFVLVTSFGCIIAALISSAHTNAFFRPQLLPVVVIFFAFVNAEITKLREKRGKSFD